MESRLPGGIGSRKESSASILFQIFGYLQSEKEEQEQSLAEEVTVFMTSKKSTLGDAAGELWRKEEKLRIKEKSVIENVVDCVFSCLFGFRKTLPQFSFTFLFLSCSFLFLSFSYPFYFFFSYFTLLFLTLFSSFSSFLHLLDKTYTQSTQFFAFKATERAPSS